MSKYKIICLGSTRAVGKDTFYSLLKEIDGNFVRFAFADQLKEMLQPVCINLFKKYINQLTPEEKEIFRPVMISVGAAARTIDKDFWVRKVSSQLGAAYATAVITDLRYLSEYEHLRKQWGAEMLFVNIEREGAPPPTDEEKIHGPEVARMADVTLKWHSDETLVSLRPIVKEFYNKYLV